jgi:hypothetical protein
MTVLKKALEGLLRTLGADLTGLHASLEQSRLLTARLLVEQLRARGPLVRLRDAEFKVFSQFGDDGIIQHLIRALGPMPERFIEFGVEDYSESNTRFLLLNDNWSGLVLDGSAAHVERIRRQDFYWRHTLTAVQAFVDRDNVNQLFRDHGFAGEIGLLSIDIDGNDYWVWEAIDAVDPVFVVCEYNAVFGPSRAVTVPYDPAFQRTRAHPSNLYWGASLKALCVLAERKGFAFVGANGAGNNAYFVRRDRLGGLRALGSEEGFVESRFRQSRDSQGRLTFLSGDSQMQAIMNEQVMDVERGELIQLSDLRNRSAD